MTRSCPLCATTNRRELLYLYQTTFCGLQYIFACCCGMVYVDNSLEPDYAANSTYARAGGTGSGMGDRARLESTAKLIKSLNLPKGASILDEGCAQGGLLDALRDQGFSDLTGFDLSPICTEATANRGHKLLADSQRFDLIIFNHVLEHVDNPQALLWQAVGRLKPTGQIYVEVPNALRYSIPFLDFNSEHINHFDSCSLKRLLEGVGLFGGTVQERMIELANGMEYPVLWTLTRRSRTVIAMDEFIKRSELKMEKLNKRLESELEGEREVILWGAGEFLAHILRLPIFRSFPIAQIVDSNVEGRLGNGLMVMKPSEIFSGCPILITALVAAPSIKKQIIELNLTNRIIEMSFN